MRILYCTTVYGTMGFFKAFIKELIEKGNQVDIATNMTNARNPEPYNRMGCHIYKIPWGRTPIRMETIRAIIELRKIILNGKYDIVHCHTPVAAVCTRVACKKLRNKGIKVIYTAHGFHFYHGAPLKDWILHYPIEKFCSRFTDVLITINKEDYIRAKSKLKAKRIEYVPGVGIDMSAFNPDNIEERTKKELRKNLGIETSTKIFLSVGELSRRKNHKVVLEALSKYKYVDYKYFIVGIGELETYLKQLITEYKLSNRVELLGHRDDVPVLCCIADLFIFPSLQEGLPVALMEAISSRTPIICSKIRGNIELASPENLFSPENPDEVLEKLETFRKGELQESVINNYENLSKFEIKKVNEVIMSIYQEVLDDKLKTPNCKP